MLIISPLPTFVNSGAYNTKKALAFASAFLWLGMRDLNPHKQSQSLSCCHYTNPQRFQRTILYHKGFGLSIGFLNFFEFFIPASSAA